MPTHKTMVVVSVAVISIAGPWRAWGQSPVPTLEQAKQILQAGQYDQAETQLKQIVNQQPDSAEAYFNLGLSLHLQMELEQAIQTYEQAIKLDPTYDQPYTNKGLALIESNQLDEASAVFRQVLALPERAESPASIHTLAHYNLAIILKRQGKFSEAHKAVNAALAITPNFDKAQKLRQLLY